MTAKLAYIGTFNKNFVKWYAETKILESLFKWFEDRKHGDFRWDVWNSEGGAGLWLRRICFSYSRMVLLINFP